MSASAKSLACLLLCASLAPAHAADFTLEVPLRIENAPSIVSVRIDCLVSRIAEGGPLQSGGTNVIGRGSQLVRTLGANQDSVVTVLVNADGIIPAAEARSYICGLNASGTSRTGSGYALSPDNLSYTYETATGQALVRSTSRISGNLP